MAKMTKERMLEIVNENISKIKEKKFNVFFFVLDTKGNPSSALEYIYKTAKVLNDKGYNVTMLHNEKDFVGVGDWLGKEYAELKHSNIEKDNVETSPSDFLFIPEIFANVMLQTKTLSCKRVVIVQTAEHITEFMPASHTFDTLNITDAIVTTEAQRRRLDSYFRGIRTHKVSPAIRDIFKEGTEPRKLLINIVSKEQSDINKIVKPFYWKNPIYKWVSFRDLRGLPQEMFAEALREAAFTIWIDDKSSFGYAPLEALRCGTITLGKIPNELSDWMDKEGSLCTSVLWFDNYDDLTSIFLPNLIHSWLNDEIPEEIYNDSKLLNDTYTEKNQEEEIEKAYITELFDHRLKEFEETKADIENNRLKIDE